MVHCVGNVPNSGMLRTIARGMRLAGPRRFHGCEKIMSQRSTSGVRRLALVTGASSGIGCSPRVSSRETTISSSQPRTRLTLWHR